MNLEITIEKKVESLNVFNSKHWRFRVKEKKAWSDLIWVALVKKYKLTWKNKKFNRIAIDSIRKRVVDKDNLIGGCKQLIDSIKGLGLIIDDDPKSIEVTYTQSKCVPNEPDKTEIKFWNEND